MKEITDHILNRQSDAVAGGVSGGAAGGDAAFTVARQGWLEIMKGQKAQRRYFRLQVSRRRQNKSVSLLLQQLQLLTCPAAKVCHNHIVCVG